LNFKLLILSSLLWSQTNCDSSSDSYRALQTAFNEEVSLSESKRDSGSEEEKKAEYTSGSNAEEVLPVIEEDDSAPVPQMHLFQGSIL